MSIDLGPGDSTSLFTLPAASWTALNRRAALVASGWAPTYAAQFRTPTGAPATLAPGYDGDTYTTHCQQWCSTYFAHLPAIAAQMVALVDQLDSLNAAVDSLPTADFTTQFAALATTVQDTHQSVIAFCDFFGTYLGETAQADAVADWHLSQIPAGTYPQPTVYLQAFGVMPATLQTLLGQFQAGWLSLAEQFEAGSAAVQKADAADASSQIAAELDLGAAAIDWQGVRSALTDFATLAAAQQPNFGGDYLYTQFPPFPGVTIGEGYYLGFLDHWLQLPSLPSDPVSLVSCPQYDLANRGVQLWTFEPIPGGYGSYYLKNSMYGGNWVLTCQPDPGSFSLYSLLIAPKEPVPTNGWQFFDYGTIPGQPVYSLANAAYGLVQQLAMLYGGSLKTPCLTLNLNVSTAESYLSLSTAESPPKCATSLQYVAPGDIGPPPLPTPPGPGGMEEPAPEEPEGPMGPGEPPGFPGGPRPGGPGGYFMA